MNQWNKSCLLVKFRYPKWYFFNCRNGCYESGTILKIILNTFGDVMFLIDHLNSFTELK